MAFDAAARTAELEELYLSDDGGWRAIKALADPLGIEKPDGGWDDAISLIVEAEQAAASEPEPETPIKLELPKAETKTTPTDTPWRKVRTDLYGNVIPNPWQ